MRLPRSFDLAPCFAKATQGRQDRCARKDGKWIPAPAFAGVTFLRRNDNIKNPKPGELTNGEKFIYFAVLARDVLTIIKVNPVKIQISNGA
jgi:hypothetical protein